MTSVSRRTFLAATAGAALAACSKTTAKKPVAAQSPASTAPSSTAAASTSTTAPSGGAAKVVYSGPRDRMQVALTFHGSGDPALTQRLLDEAARLRVPITVFAVGTWLRDHPDMTRRILDGGHELENHTFTHPQLRGAGAATIRREVVGCRDVLTAQTENGGRYFRPSGMEGDYPAVVMEEAGLAGYRVVCGFDVDPLDYQDPGPAVIEDRVRHSLKPGSIVSLHLGHTGTVTAFPSLVGDIRARTLQPVAVAELLA